MALVGGAFEVAAGNWGHKHKLYQLPPAPPHFTLFSVSVCQSLKRFVYSCLALLHILKWVVDTTSTTITCVGLVLRTNTCTASTLEISAFQQRLNWSQTADESASYDAFQITAFELVPVFLLSSNIVLLSNFVHHNWLHKNSLICYHRVTI